MRFLRRTTLAVLATLLIAVAGVGIAGADAFRYWGFYQSTEGTWGFATTGAGESVPADGSVEGWRFAVAGETSMRPPRAEVEFADVCGAEPADAGKKRVAVVLDYGTPDDAPEGEPPAAQGACAVVDEAATSLDALTAVADARVEGGLVCGIDDYPATGCGDPVPGDAPTDDGQPVELVLPAADTPEPTASDDRATGLQVDDDNNAGIWITAAALLAAVVALGVLAVRRRRPSAD